MLDKSLGLIETQGLAAAVEAADAAVKSANVQLIGYELTRGGGWCTVKIEGDVGAVKAAIQAAEVASAKVNRVISTHVIARPAQNIEKIVFNKNTVGFKAASQSSVSVPKAKPEHKSQIQDELQPQPEQKPRDKAVSESQTKEEQSGASAQPERIAKHKSNGKTNPGKSK